MNAIIHMKHAMGDTEYIRDVQDAEYRKRLAAKNEALAICTVIAKYFTAEKWDAWCDASPGDEIEFLAYVQTEAAYIITEMFDAEQVEQADETAKDAEWLGIETHIAAAYMQPDPRTLDQIANDLDDADTMQTRESDIPNHQFGSHAWFAGVDPEEF